MTDRERPKNTLRQTDLLLLIQGGMGVGVSNWELAKAVSIEGQLGVVSGTGINTVFIRRLQDGLLTPANNWTLLKRNVLQYRSNS